MSDPDRYNVHEAKTHLSRLLERVSRGEEIVIARDGDPVAKLVPFTGERRAPGRLRGRLEIAPDFDAPLPKEISEALSGRRD